MKIAQIEDLRISTADETGSPRELLHGVSFDIEEGEAVGLVGESGSGKSLTARALIGLFLGGMEASGSVRVGGIEVVGAARDDLRELRSSVASMIFQDPRAHINPMRTIGDFLTEALVTVRGVPAAEARSRAVDLMREIGISDPEQRMRQYSGEFSGGLLQRVMIAAAMLIGPRLLLADEPTTALDVTTQEEVMAILNELREQRGMSMLFITHDLDLAASVCDRLIVMREGRIVEELATQELYRGRHHPYTRELLAARLVIDLGEEAR